MTRPPCCVQIRRLLYVPEAPGVATEDLRAGASRLSLVRAKSACAFRVLKVPQCQGLCEMVLNTERGRSRVSSLRGAEGLIRGSCVA